VPKLVKAVARGAARSMPQVLARGRGKYLDIKIKYLRR
jgi:hypothetical protein